MNTNEILYGVLHALALEIIYAASFPQALVFPIRLAIALHSADKMANIERASYSAKNSTRKSDGKKYFLYLRPTHSAQWSI